MSSPTMSEMRGDGDRFQLDAYALERRRLYETHRNRSINIRRFFALTVPALPPKTERARANRSTASQLDQRADR
jgi:hypothetical protein